MEKTPAFVPNLRIPLVGDNPGNVYKSKKMPTLIVLVEILLQLRLHGMQLAPSHVKRDFNAWADELTHPDFVGLTPSLRLAPSACASPVGLRKAPGEDVAASWPASCWAVQNQCRAPGQVWMDSSTEGSCSWESAATPIHHAKGSACLHGFGVPFSCGYLTYMCVENDIETQRRDIPNT